MRFLRALIPDFLKESLYKPIIDVAAIKIRIICIRGIL